MSALFYYNRLIWMRMRTLLFTVFMCYCCWIFIWFFFDWTAHFFSYIFLQAFPLWFWCILDRFHWWIFNLPVQFRFQFYIYCIRTILDWILSAKFFFNHCIISTNNFHSYFDRKQSFITRNINSARRIEINRQIELNHISSITLNIKKDQQKQQQKNEKTR